MQAVVLAGGYATRLWPITRNRPKMFLPVGETTVIDRILEELEADHRIDRVLVSTNERFADAFREHVSRRDYEKPELSIEETTDEDEKFGVVGALAQLVEREDVDDDLLVVAGDNLLGFDLSDFLDYFLERGTPTLAAYDVGTRERAEAYGVLELEGEQVVAMQEKPDAPESTLVSIACYAFPADALRFQEYLAGDNNPDEPGWYAQWLVEQGPVYAFGFDDPWFDIGTPESYLEAIEWALDGERVVADDAVVEHADLGPNVHVMEGARIRRATVERSVVFPGAEVRDATVRSSLVDEQSRVEGIDLEASLVGGYSRLQDHEE